MAKENCSLCGKNTGFWGRFELKDGYICDACFDSAKCIKYDLDIFKTTTYTVNMLQNIKHYLMLLKIQMIRQEESK